MGLEIEQDEFAEAHYEQFAEQLRREVAALAEVLARPGFGIGPPTIGAELETFLVDEAGRPLPINRAVLADTVHPGLTVETDRFNLECNTRPVALAGRPFAALGREVRDALGAIAGAAAPHGGRTAVIGILPTLQLSDLTAGALTDLPRYRALSAGIRRLRQQPFRVAIAGDDTLELRCEDVTFEGANTSWQVHLRVPPAEFARTYNAAQIAIGPTLAVAGNSPTFLGRRLWEETRVALFRQAVDERDDDDWRPARVSFGHGWVRSGALELFAESVALHPPLLPVLVTDDALAAARGGGVPALRALRLHQGTVWRWNRAVYDPSAGGHVRIEMRALPAGPSLPDMLANAAFLLGLTLGLAPDVDRLLHRLTFGHARRNFYCAAQYGLDAQLLWPSDAFPSPRLARASELVTRLLPTAHAGLAGAGVAPDEIERLLGIIASRASARLTGARWQRRVLDELERRLPREQALAAMLERYLAHAGGDVPVHCWPIAG